MPQVSTIFSHLRLPSPTPLWTAVLQSAVIALLSNTVAQSLHAHQTRTSFTSSFSFVTLLRFLALDLITAPPNYKWQEFLEGTWPARPDGAKGRQRQRRRKLRESGDYGYEAVPMQDVELGEGQDHRRAGKQDDTEIDNDLQRRDEGALDVPRRQSRSQQSTSHPRPLDVSSRPPLSWRNTFVKWFVDCVTLGAIFNTLGFLVIMGILKGEPSKIPYNIRHETLSIIWNGYKIWPIANMIAHTLVPVEKKIVWFAFVGLCWNVYLSLVAIRI